MDLESRRRRKLYTKAREVMPERARIPEAPRWVVEAVDKKKARLKLIHHRLRQIPHGEVEHAPVTLPDRVHHLDHLRNPALASMMLPSAYRGLKRAWRLLLLVCDTREGVAF